MTTPLRTPLNVPSVRNASVMFERCCTSTSRAGGISFSARSRTSRCAANVPANRSRLRMESTMCVRFVARTPATSLSRDNSWRVSSVRPLSAAPVLRMTSPICPRPPPLTRIDRVDKVSSVEGKVDELFTSIVVPARSRPRGDSPGGGSSARCIEPSRLVCPTVATALAGTTTSFCTEISTTACQSRALIVRMLPTTTSSIITGELGSSVPTFVSWTTNV